MAQSFFFSLILLVFQASPGHGITEGIPSESVSSQRTDSINQSLYNGRIWQNSYYMIKENQFLFSTSFLAGSVTMRGKTFSDVSLRYDIFSDELLIPFYSGGIMQLNKEMVDSFSIVYNGKEYRFVNFPVDPTGGPNGYFNVLYHGKSDLLVKYLKKIEKLSEGKFDSFYDLKKIYIRKDGHFHLIRGKKDVIMLFQDKKAIKGFVKANKLDLSNDEPESYIPVLGYMDKLAQKR